MRSRRRRGVWRGTETSIGAESASSISRPRVCDIGKALFAVLPEAPARSLDIDGGVCSGSTVQSGSRAMTLASDAGALSPPNTRVPDNISNTTQPKAQTSDCSST